MNKVVLGTGILTWDGKERRSDRYGTVWLVSLEDHINYGQTTDSLIDESTVRSLIGKKGVLEAHVIETRVSHHIGDLFRGLFPRRPAVGQTIRLGHGRLFTENLRCGDGIMVGLEPHDGRCNDWLDPRALYDAHDQTVELYFIPGEAG